MYNSHQHRGMVPPGPPAPDQRLNELLDQVRAEFNAQAGRSGEYENQISQQIHEMEAVRRQIYELERRHHEMKIRYEEENANLRREIQMHGVARDGTAPPPHAHQPPPQQPPAIGHGQGTLFGGIMGGNAQGAGGPGLAPPPPPGMAQERPGVGPGPPGAPPGPPGHFGGYPAAPNGYGPQAAQTAGSPGKPPRVGRGPAAPTTPQQTPIAIPPGVPDVGNHLADLDPENIPPTHKREGQDWFAIFNPRAPRRLDVDLVHNLAHNSVVCCVRFSAAGHYIATACNRSAQIFDVETGQQVALLQDQSLPPDGDLYIRSVCFSPDGRYLATGAEDKIIRVWDISAKIIRNEFRGHEQDIYSLDFARNGRIIASGSGDRSVRLWDLESNSPVMTLSIEDGVTTVAISPDNRYVAAGSLDKSVRVWDTQNGFLVERLEGERGHRDSVYSVAFSPSGQQLVSGSLDKTIKMWELTAPSGRMPGQPPSGGKCIRTFEGHKDFVLSVALTPDGAWVLSGSKDRGVQFWDPHTGEAQLMLQGHKNSVISVAPSPRGGVFATGSGDQRARIWRYGPVNQY